MVPSEIKRKLSEASLYAVTDIRNFDMHVLDQVDAAYRGGADIVQLRSKVLTDREFIDLGLKISSIAKKYQKLFVMNDRVDLAALSQADGVHLGQNDLSVSQARALLEKFGRADMFIGKSTHAIDQALLAEREGADYIGVGPVYETPTKPGKQSVGLSYVREVHSSVCIPKVVIGGIHEEVLSEVLHAGAECVAMVRALFDNGDVFTKTQNIRGIIDGIKIKS